MSENKCEKCGQEIEREKEYRCNNCDKFFRRGEEVEFNDIGYVYFFLCSAECKKEYYTHLWEKDNARIVCISLDDPKGACSSKNCPYHEESEEERCKYFKTEYDREYSYTIYASCSNPKVIKIIQGKIK